MNYDSYKWTCEKLPCDLPKIISPQGQNHTDVILSGDKPGRLTSTTRQRRIAITEHIGLNIHSYDFRESSSLFMRARHRERQSFAYFSSAVERKVRRQQANLKTSAQDYGYTCSARPEHYY